MTQTAGNSCFVHVIASQCGHRRGVHPAGVIRPRLRSCAACAHWRGVCLQEQSLLSGRRRRALRVGVGPYGAILVFQRRGGPWPPAAAGSLLSLPMGEVPRCAHRGGEGCASLWRKGGAERSEAEGSKGRRAIDPPPPAAEPPFSKGSQRDAREACDAILACQRDAREACNAILACQRDTREACDAILACQKQT